MRHVFDMREGINPLEQEMHSRIIGSQPLEEGPHAHNTVDIKAEIYWNLGVLEWDRTKTIHSKRKLLELGLAYVAKDLWQEPVSPAVTWIKIHCLQRRPSDVVVTR